MIALPAGTNIWIAAGVTDLRRGFTGLSAVAQTVLAMASNLGLQVAAVRTFRRYTLGATLSAADRDLLFRKVLANPAVEQVVEVL